MERRRARAVAGTLAALAALLALAVNTEVFPYRSLNHDEAVYLQQAAMLLEGQLNLYPPVPDAMRPWFFVRDGGRLYPKYGPVPAAVFALGKLLGGFRLALAGVAAALALGTYDLAARAFDRRAGLLAAGFLLCSPLFLANAAVYLSYAPTTALNLAFAAAVLRARDRESPPWGAAAGCAIGLAFFARPFTAVLFAVPFIALALWELGTRRDRATLARHGATAAVGSLWVGVALAYNATMTGSPWLFPYEAFAPLDGLGFGRRRILGYERVYDPALALRANARVLTALFGEWVAAGWVGTALAGLGLLAAARRARAGRVRAEPVLLAGLFVSVPLGNLFFWGNLNVLGTLADPTDGLIALLGPYYHFDLLVPTAAFAGAGALALAGRCRAVAASLAGPNGRKRRVLLAAALVVGAATFGAVAVDAAADPLAENREITAEYRAAYEPFADRSFASDRALVFLPTPYGPWLHHPFQALRNDPGYGGPVVYALDRDEENFPVLRAFPNRTVYRFTYRGVWNPGDEIPVNAHLRRVGDVRGERVVLALDLGLPEAADVSARLAAEDGDQTYYVIDGDANGSDLRARLVLANGTARLVGEGIAATGPDPDAAIPVAGPTELDLTVFVDAGVGRRVSYRFELPALVGDRIRALSPYVEVCERPRRCGGEAAYVPGADVPAWVRVDAALRAGNETGNLSVAGARAQIRFRSAAGSAARARSAAPTRRIERAMAPPPERGSSVVSPRRSRYSIGISRTS
jgi:4-amino-4-deoxy-L-arabinose transferase-like glycosyltransferase